MVDDLTWRKVHLILSDCPNDKAFFVSNGFYLRNLHELADSLLHMDLEVFQSHVNSHKNDFYKWILDVLEDEILADSIRHVHDQQKMQEIVRARVDELDRVEVEFEEQGKEYQQQTQPAAPETMSTHEMHEMVQEAKNESIPVAPSVDENKFTIDAFFMYGSRDFFFGILIGFLIGLFVGSFF